MHPAEIRGRLQWQAYRQRKLHGSAHRDEDSDRAADRLKKCRGDHPPQAQDRTDRHRRTNDSERQWEQHLPRRGRDGVGKLPQRSPGQQERKRQCDLMQGSRREACDPASAQGRIALLTSQRLERRPTPRVERERLSLVHTGAIPAVMAADYGQRRHGGRLVDGVRYVSTNSAAARLCANSYSLDAPLVVFRRQIGQVVVTALGDRSRLRPIRNRCAGPPGGRRRAGLRLTSRGRYPFLRPSQNTGGKGPLGCSQYCLKLFGEDRQRAAASVCLAAAGDRYLRWALSWKADPRCRAADRAGIADDDVITPRFTTAAAALICRFGRGIDNVRRREGDCGGRSRAA